MSKPRHLSLLFLLLAPFLRAAPPTWNLDSTEGGPAVQVRLDETGSLWWKVLLGKKTILPESPLGLLLAGGGGDFLQGLVFEGETRRSFTEDFTLASGKRLKNHYRFGELSLAFHNQAGKKLVVLFRNARDGAAFRYLLPGKGKFKLEREKTALFLSPGTRVWMQKWRRNYENLFQEGILGTDFNPDRYVFPLLVKYGESAGPWALFTEADLPGNYAAATLALLSRDTSRLRIYLPALPVQGSRPLATPWRVVLAGSLKDLVESTLVEALNPPAETKDISWIHPGKCAWSWWSASKSPHSLARQKDFVDFAASLGWRYCLVDEGWKEHEWVPELVRYAKAKGVGIILWSRWTDLDTPEKREKELSLWKSWGIVGIKVDFMDCDCQERMAFYEAMRKAALEKKLALNFHGATLPKGERRRFPNLLTQEGVLGAEHYKWSSRPTPRHNCILPFTRNVVGPMDYTPITFSAKRRKTTAAHELALGVVFESGIQHFADSPETYRSAPYKACLDFFRQVPTAWDETRFLGGYPGKLVMLARRKGKRWFLGVIAAGDPTRGGRKISLPLSGFLGKGTWKAEAFRDRPGKKDGLVRETSTVQGDSVLDLHLKKNGGLVMIFTP